MEKTKNLLLGSHKRRKTTLWVGVTIAYAIITIFFVGTALFKGYPVITSAKPGDGTAGLTWLAWIDTGGPTPDVITHLTNYPFGDSLRDPFQITSLFNIGGMWLFSQLFSAIAAWNIMVFLGYMSSALVMFAFIRWLLKNTWVAFFAGFAVTFTPYHQFNATGHLSYVFNAMFILLLWAFLVFWRNPTKKTIILLSLATAGCIYFDGYFTLLAGILLVGLIASSYLADVFIFKQPAKYLLKRLKALLLYGACVIVLLIPVVLTQLKFGQQISSTLANSRGDIASEVEVYSARPYEYILPADNNPLLPESYKTYRQDLLHGSNFTENTLFLGFTTIILASYVWWHIRKKRVENESLQSMKLTFLATVLSGTAITAFLVSLQPTISIFGQTLPMPSWFMYHLTASWRVYARLYLIVDLALVVLASVGLYLLIKKYRLRKQVIVVTLAICISFLELMTSSRGVTWNYNSSPYVYQWLNRQNSVKVLAEYPLDTPPSQSVSDYLTYQQIHGKAIINTSRADSPQKNLQLSIGGLEDSQTLPVLRRLGADTVLSHRTPVNIDGLQFIRYDKSKFSDDAVWAYRLLDGDKATYALTVGLGWHKPEIKNNHSTITMGTHGVLNIMNLTKNKSHDTVRVTLSANSLTGKPQMITISQSGLNVWSGEVDKNSAISFDADPSLPIDILPYKSNADRTIQIYDLKAE